MLSKKNIDFQANPKEFFVSEANFTTKLIFSTSTGSFLKNLNLPFFYIHNIKSNGWYAKSIVNGVTNLNSVFKRNITEKVRHRFPVMNTPDSFRQQRTYIYRLDFRTFFHLIFDRNSVRHNYLKKRNLKKK